MSEHTIQRWKTDFKSNGNRKYIHEYPSITNDPPLTRARARARTRAQKVLRPKRICSLALISRFTGFSESLLGKHIHYWILEDKVMDGRAKEYLRTNVTRKATKNKAVFQIADFQDFLNKDLLPRWQVKSWDGVYYLVKDVDPYSKFLQVSEAYTLVWAHKLGMCYTTKTKSYYVNGHDRKDVLAYRKKWLAQDLKLKLGQYLWAPFTEEDLYTCEFTKDGKNLNIYDYLFNKAEADTNNDTGGGNEESVDEAQSV